MISSIQSEEKIIEVIIVDDLLTVRKNLELQLSIANDIKVVALAEDGVDALKKISDLSPDVIVIDLEMPNMDGITAIKEISTRFPKTKTLVFSTHEEREYINRAIIAGAKGYLLKGTPAEDLIVAVRNVYRGYFQLGSGLLNHLSSLESSKSLDVSSLPSNKEFNVQETINIGKISDLIEIQVNNSYDELESMLLGKTNAIAVQQSKYYARLKKIQLKVYFLLCWQAILTLILLLNV